MVPNNTNRRYLLGESDVSSAPFVSTTEASAKLTLADLFITVNNYKFPREDTVPAGCYYSKVMDMQLREKRNGAQVLDVMYEIKGYDAQNRGQVFHIKQAYAPGSDRMKAFFDAMVAAGIKVGSNITAAIGVVERIKLEYDSGASGLGGIAARIPCGEDAEVDDEEETSAAESDPDLLSDEED